MLAAKRDFPLEVCAPSFVSDNIERGIRKTLEGNAILDEQLIFGLAFSVVDLRQVHALAKQTRIIRLDIVDARGRRECVSSDEPDLNDA